MNNELLEQLLNEEESSSLDFKRDQYPFEGAIDEKKSELLKDILAFANAWRRTDAYILIGVEEVRGAKSKVVGLSQHLDDAKLQQFVNSKTQKAITFSYEAYPYEGLQIGIISIPIQDRPVYLTKDYGRLRKNVVYLRRGSSTDEATPDEIAQIGAAKNQAVLDEPVLSFQFASIKNRAELGVSVSVQSVILSPVIDAKLLEPKSQSQAVSNFMSTGTGFNSSYYQELVQYTFDVNLLTPLGFVIENKSGRVALGLQVKAFIDTQPGVCLFDEDDAPTRPAKNRLYEPKIHRLHIPGLQRPDPIITKRGTKWELVINFGKVMPREKVWTTGVVFIGGDHPQVVEMDSYLYAENLSEPIRVPLVARIETETRSMKISDVRRQENLIE